VRIGNTDDKQIGWYLALGAIPFSWILFTLTQSKSSEDNKPFLTRLMHKYSSWEEEWKLRNELHTKSVEQAGFDRLLFQHEVNAEGRGTGRKDVRFEEYVSQSSTHSNLMLTFNSSSMNQGPPMNVAPGAYVNLDKVIDHYNKVNEETEQRRQHIEKYYEEKERPGASISRKGLYMS
jgi:hypothetical protein